MFFNIDRSNIAVQTVKAAVANADHYAFSGTDDMQNSDKIILQPGLTFRNITNNTSEPMDITAVIATLDKQLQTRLD